MRWLAGLMLLVLLPGVALAGAWPRGKGNVYLYASGFGDIDEALAQMQRGQPAPYELTFFGEYGLTDRWTLGLEGLYASNAAINVGVDFGACDPGDPRTKSEATLSVSRALGRGRHKWALSVGAQHRQDEDGQQHWLPRLGLHWGYGGNRGWLAADAYVLKAPESGVEITPLTNPCQIEIQARRNDMEWKADLTAGLKLFKRVQLSAQLQTGQGVLGDPYAKIVPKIGVSFGEKLRTHLELGYIHEIENAPGRKVLLGMAISF